ncbi:olfactory receptor 5G9-like [Candoia aspera]|uniref:olfactory receptor 5G9-like n=1 Tax=Candoia aspera TaxID=51853 RepID=UPI002FD83223
MLAGEQGNETGITKFILLGLGNHTELWPFLFLVFLVIYLVTITGNIFIIVLVAVDQHLHTPMYFFLRNLSCLEICYTSTILPKMLSNLLTGDRTITVSGCLCQYYFFGSCVGVEAFLLAAMSYDRYLAICRPLFYASVMNRKLCFQLTAGAWLNGVMANSIVVFLLAQFPFCGSNAIDHYFCELFPLEKLTCSDPKLFKLIVLLLAFIFTIPPFLLTISSYVHIIASVIRIQSTIGRRKAFSTCSSHLAVVCLFYGTIIIVYLLPDSLTLRQLNKIFSIFYTILTPLVNPLIYTLRNKEVHKALRRVLIKLAFFGGERII